MLKTRMLVLIQGLSAAHAALGPQHNTPICCAMCFSLPHRKGLSISQKHRTGGCFLEPVHPLFSDLQITCKWPQTHSTNTPLFSPTHPSSAHSRKAQLKRAEWKKGEVFWWPKQTKGLKIIAFYEPSALCMVSSAHCNSYYCQNHITIPQNPLYDACDTSTVQRNSTVQRKQPFPFCKENSQEHMPGLRGGGPGGGLPGARLLGLPAAARRRGRAL